MKISRSALYMLIIGLFFNCGQSSTNKTIISPQDLENSSCQYKEKLYDYIEENHNKNQRFFKKNTWKINRDISWKGIRNRFKDYFWKKNQISELEKKYNLLPIDLDNLHYQQIDLNSSVDDDKGINIKKVKINGSKSNLDGKILAYKRVEESEIEINISLPDHENILKALAYSRKSDFFGKVSIYMPIPDNYITLSHYIKLYKNNTGSYMFFLKAINMVSIGLKVLKKAGIVHGDIKPENILINNSTEDIKIKIIDFGTSFQLKKGIKPTGKAEYIGTGKYRASEISEAKDYKDLDYSVDVYSLGEIVNDMFEIRSRANYLRYFGKPDPRLKKLDYDPTFIKKLYEKTTCRKRNDRLDIESINKKIEKEIKRVSQSTSVMKKKQNINMKLL